MSALSLFVLCCALVQVQSFAPYVFSSRTHYHADSTNSVSGESLVDATFHCRFNGPLGGIIGWSDTSVSAVLSALQVETDEPDFTIAAVGVPDSVNMYGFDFTLRTTGVVPSTMRINIKALPGFFCSVTDEECAEGSVGSDFTNNIGSPTYTISVGSTLAYEVDWNSQGIDQLSAYITFNHAPYTRDLTLVNMYFTVDGQEVSESHQVFIAVSEKSWLFNIDVATLGSTVCLIPLAADGPVVGDVYGNAIDAASFRADTNMCFTMPAEQLCGDWSEWSDTCRYKNCIPIEADRQYNVQSRTRQSEAFPNCDVPPETRQCLYRPDMAECSVRIRSSETGTECANTCDSGGIIPGRSCQCGGTCVADGNCCQSYYSSCIGEEEATSNPDYFYLYAPCWNPSECTNGAPVPPTSFACGTFSNNQAGGECDGRPYKYSCYCGFNPASRLTCQNVGGNDLCCNGGDSWASICDAR